MYLKNILLVAMAVESLFKALCTLNVDPYQTMTYMYLIQGILFCSDKPV